MGGVESKKVYMLVGAEEERKQLEALLIQRAKFTGDTLQLKQLNVTSEGEAESGKGGECLVCCCRWIGFDCMG